MGGCGRWPLPIGRVMAIGLSRVDLVRATPAGQLDDQPRRAQQRARRGDQQSQVRARRRRRTRAAPRPATARDRARRPGRRVPSSSVTMPASPRAVLAADQRRQLGLRGVGTRGREQPLAVRQRDGGSGAVGHGLQRRRVRAARPGSRPRPARGLPRGTRAAATMNARPCDRGEPGRDAGLARLAHARTRRSSVRRRRETRPHQSRARRRASPRPDSANSARYGAHQSSFSSRSSNV